MTRPGDGPQRDADRDAHLVAALRHAPDAEAQAPPLLRARIVAAALRSAQASPAGEPWQRRLGSWLQAPWRMGGAGTLAAALLAATVLWVGRDEQPAAPDLRAPPPAAAPAPAPEKATAPAMPAPGAGGPAAAGSPHAASADAPLAGSPSNAATERDERAVVRTARPATAIGATARSDTGSAGRERDTSTAERAAALAETTAGAPRPATAAPTSAPIAAAPAPRVQQSPGGTPALATPSSPSAAQPVVPTAPAGTAPVAAPAAAPITAPGTSAAPAPAPAAAPEPAPFRSTTRPAAAPAARQAPAPAEPGEPARRRESVADAARLGTSPPATLSGARGAVTAPASAASLALGAAAGSTQSMLGGRASIVESWSAAADLAAWRWRAVGGEETALPTGWIAALMAATQGRWVSSAAATAASAADIIQLVHQGSARGSLAWLAGGVLACETSGRCEQASLDPATRDTLREALRRR